MPMIVDPSAPHITPPSPVVSPDGWLTASVDVTYAGVYLGVDYKSPADTARNLALNPSLEVDLANTSGYGANISRFWDTSQAKVGAAAMRMHHNGTTIAGSSWSIEPVSDGGTVQVAIWVKLPASGFTTGNLAWRSGSTTLKTQTLVPPTSGGWTEITGSYTLTSGQTCDNIGLSFQPTAAGTEWYADALMVENSDTLHPYVDGSQPGCIWEGAANASVSRRVTSDQPWQNIRKVRIMRSDPGKPAVPVRSADTAWAIEGVGAAYDHEAPLGVAVVYTATPILADGSTLAPSSLSVTVTEPDPPADVWIKSLDEPALSARVTVTSWPQLQWSSRIDTADVAGSPYAATSQDVYAAAASDISLDAEGSQIELLRKLLTTPGVRLIQTRGANRRPDQFVLFGDPAEAVDTTPDGVRTFTASVREVARPDTAGQPMRTPGWSWDILAANYASYDAVAATFSSYQQLATNGVLG